MSDHQALMPEELKLVNLVNSLSPEDNAYWIVANVLIKQLQVRIYTSEKLTIFQR